MNLLLIWQRVDEMSQLCDFLGFVSIYTDIGFLILILCNRLYSQEGIVSLELLTEMNQLLWLGSL